MANTVTVSGMFGAGNTYFADSPVVIDISGLAWPPSSPFNIVLVEVVFDGKVAGSFRNESGGQPDISFDISSALHAIWSSEPFNAETAAASAAVRDETEDGQAASRPMRSYYLRIYTEYLSTDNVFVTTQCQDEYGNTDIPGGQCLLGGYTEWERSLITEKADADVSHLEHTGVRNGDASTKPASSPERVGKSSITSWVDVQAGFTRSIFYPASHEPEPDDTPSAAEGWNGHAPIVLRDSVAYADFLFLNRRGAIETCSGNVLKALNIDVETEQYYRRECPTFSPKQVVTSRATGGRRSWLMSSGGQTREWATWWTMEFLMSSRHWMLYKGRFVPVTVSPAKKSTSIYDQTKQQMPHVDFTVTLTLEG